MTLSQEGLQAVLAAATEKVFLECLTIEHSLINPMRLVNDKQDLPRSAGIYSRFPFQIRAMQQTAEQPPGIEIRASVVDQRIIDAVRQLSGLREKAKITYEVVLQDQPDTLEFGPVVFEHAGTSTDSLTTLTLRAVFLPGALDDAFPGDFFGPGNVQGA